ncbi:DUF5696 domain-containing protein [Paenibacillus sp. MBLB4367]|uniref:DUF5696 domain-containing protein n=1 Tax=Paenibacillus sp. MBLB4367 TaxID=3384767 RepID=UPI0039083BCA
MKSYIRSKRFLAIALVLTMSVFTVVSSQAAESGSAGQSAAAATSTPVQQTGGAGAQKAGAAAAPGSAQPGGAQSPGTAGAAGGTPAEAAGSQAKSVGANGLFPAENAFKTAAENAVLQLKVHEGSGHFLVVDKRSGNVWRSYPNPDTWIDAENTGAWKVHLQSPLYIRYVEFNVQQHIVKETNLTEQKGSIADFQITGNGFKLTFTMPGIGFTIPVEVSLKDDYVETRILEKGLKDAKTAEEKKAFEDKNKGQKDPDARIAAIRLYPFLGAETSDSEDGYLFVPDGPGALIKFQKDRPSTTNNFYNERIYGEDMAYSFNNALSFRGPVRMPVFGIKSGDRAMLAVVQDGAEYASVTAAPSKSFSQYNWITAEHGYRFKTYMPTNTRKTTGVWTHTKDRAAKDRIVRYYFLDKSAADYSGMANRYRAYLMEEDGLKQLKTDGAAISLPVTLIGSDTEKGFIWDSYLPLTTTSQAKDIVNELSGMGVNRMSIVYTGWQKGGFSDYGGHFPLDGQLGGNGGMREFTELAHSKGHTVTLDGSSYSWNNTGRDGFRKSRDALQDLCSVIIGERMPFVSPRFMQQVIKDDLGKAKALGVDGMMYGGSVGSILSSDYNEKYAATRTETMELQDAIFQETIAELGRADAMGGNFYVNKYAKHAYALPDEYSFDLFVGETVPFAQMALHGLITYSSGYANLADNYNKTLLTNIEFGAFPSFVLTYAKSQELLRSKSLKYLYYSTNYKDWAQEIVKQYQRFNKALGDVQDQFMVSHRTLEDGVKETVYANGKRIIVNYNASDYDKGGIRVAAKDFAVIPGGK